jgi:hypothetical protein
VIADECPTHFWIEVGRIVSTGLNPVNMQVKHTADVIGAWTCAMTLMPLGLVASRPE